MKRAVHLFAFVLFGCTGAVESASTRVLVVDGAVGASVSSDQKLLAYYTDLADPNVFQGKAWVRPLPSGDPIRLGDHAFDVTFGETGQTVLFEANLKPATNSAANAPGAVFGELSIWTPTLGAPIQVSAGFDVRHTLASDQSAALFIDNPNPSMTTSGTLRFFRAADCANGKCAVTTLADGLNIGQMVLSTDGRFAAYEVINDDQTFDIFLAGVGSKPAKIATTEFTSKATNRYPLFQFSPDGSLLAVRCTLAGKPMQLEVVSTVTGKPVAWGAQPADTQCTEAAFLDAVTLFTGQLDANGDSAVYRSTAGTAATHYLDAVTFGLFPASASGPAVMFITNGSGAQGLVDLSASSPMPVTFDQSLNIGGLSEDHTSVWMIGGYDSSSQRGTLKVASVPGGVVTTVDSSIYPGGVRFGASTNRLLYFGSAGASTQTGAPIVEWNGGAPTVLEINAVTYLTASDPPTLYVSAADPLAIYTRPLP